MQNNAILKILLFSAIAMMFGLISGCGSGTSYYKDIDSAPSMSFPGESSAEFVGQAVGAPRSRDIDSDFAETPVEFESEPVEHTKNSSPAGNKVGRRLIIYVADLSLFVFDIDEALEAAGAAAKLKGGWVQRSTTEMLTIRVPVQNFDALLDALLELGTVNSKNIVGTDVSEEFFDLQIRLRNVEALRERFVKLLEQAKTVEDSLKVEKELARVTAEIERFKGRLKFLKDQGMNSTITVIFSKKPDVYRHSRVTLPFGWISGYSIESALYY